MPESKDQYKLEQLIKDLKCKDMKELRKRFEYLPKEEKAVLSPLSVEFGYSMA